ncbi:DUF3231 family protein [Bacillus sp. FJAT-49736]|uniref:DUF3231 family protein n=1 Tax=Bacillus sp. FJAT-49736 TaxID=2833582 RepID=UPI001BCA0649|nr:DUF3231 family protein [Bacillus sp. FJAT-49736]MBS4174289.1 DUF3231 family protein [Bacillus sp. FJAT-49736]
MSENDQNLISGEISQLWANYMNDSMAICMLSYFKENVEDQEVLPIIEYALELSESHIETLTNLFQKHNFPIPIGFTKEDVNLQAPRLYSDMYYLYFLQFWGATGLNGYGLSLLLAANEEVIQYFSKCIDESKELLNRTSNILLAKGAFIKTPYIPIPEKVDFIHKESFLSGWFGERRPLTTIEIANLFANKQRNILFQTTLIGFSQVVKDNDVSKIIKKGLEILKNNIDTYDEKVRESHLPAPEPWDTLVTTSTTSPYSDKLILFHLASLINMGIGLYGTSLGLSPRTDLSALNIKIISKLLLFAEDTTSIMIEKGWMEQPPSAVNRKDLADNK